MKICRRCKMGKPLNEYYGHSQMEDGFVNICKVCIRKSAKDRYNNLMKNDRNWVIRERDRCRKKGKLYYELMKNEWTEEQKINIRRLKKEWAKRNPEKIRAHLKLKRAVNKGIITKLPCQVCGNIKSEAHHWDYTKPLDVKWLCSKHHAEIHRK